MPEIAYIDGELTPIEQAVVPVEDRGLQFGDAVYEVVAGYNGRLFCLEEHLDRLEGSMAALAFPDLSRAEMRRIIQTVHDHAGLDSAAVYIQITRGNTPRQHAIPSCAQPRIIVTVRRIRALATELRETGVALTTTDDFRWGRCDIKTVQLLANVLAKQKALESGAFDAVFIGPDGTVREATSANLFFVRSGELYTHPLTRHILGGITRTAVLRLCRRLKLPAAECFMPVESLWQADELFLTGTLTEILPVVRIDGRTAGGGRPGPLTRRLARALAEELRGGGRKPLPRNSGSTAVQ